MPWLLLTLEVDAGTAEALSEGLLEAGAQSVAVEDPDAAVVRVAAIAPEGFDAAELAGRATRAAGLARIPPWSAQRMADEDWVRRSQAQFSPVRIGERLWIGPTWDAPPAGVRAIVRLDPGLAFGTGSHPTTRLMLAFLERCVRGGESVLDYGCGSGILAIAAAKLGARRIDAVDSDPEAVRAAAANARLNAVDLRSLAPEELPPASYDLVVSNILAQPLIVLAPLLAARLASGGRLALSGILESQAPDVAAAYASLVPLAVSRVEEGWALLEGTRP